MWRDWKSRASIEAVLYRRNVLGGDHHQLLLDRGYHEVNPRQNDASTWL
jgi:hypothetical protein